MPKKVMLSDVVAALNTIKEWTQAVHVELLEYQQGLAGPQAAVTAAVGAVADALVATAGAAAAAGSVESAIGDFDLATNSPGGSKVKTMVAARASGVGKGC